MRDNALYRNRVRFCLIVLCVALASCTPPQQGSPTLDLQTEAISFPSESPSGEAFLAKGADGTLYASWIEATETGGHRLQLSRFDSEENSWSTPGTIAEGDDWFVNWADVPSISIGPAGAIAAHWLARNGNGRYAYGILVSISENGGSTWSAPVWLHDDNSATEHGFAAVVPDASGGFTAVWLDGRKYASGENEMTLMSRRFGLINQAGGSPTVEMSEEVLLDERTCDCCPNAAVVTAAGTTVIAYRDRSEDEIRDIFVARRVDGAWQEPGRIAEDNWQINACPVNGPAIDARGENLAAAWFTAANDTPLVQVAFSSDDGITFQAPIRVDEGSPTGRVSVVMEDSGTAIVMWIESGTGETDAGITVRRVHRNGSVSNPVIVAPTSASRASGYPRMARLEDRLVFLWTQTGDDPRVVSAVSEFAGD